MSALCLNPYHAQSDRQGGEDLRGDQRVEQLFDVMNGLLAHHPAAQAADLKVRGHTPRQVAWHVTHAHPDVDHGNPLSEPLLSIRILCQAHLVHCLRQGPSNCAHEHKWCGSRCEAQVTTYDVIPVSQSVGLMEFVPDTEQLLTVISPGVIPAEDVDAGRKAYSSCATRFTQSATTSRPLDHACADVSGNRPKACTLSTC